MTLLVIDIVVFLGAIVAQVVLTQRAARAADPDVRVANERRSSLLLRASTTAVIVLTIAFIADMATLGL